MGKYKLYIIVLLVLICLEMRAGWSQSYSPNICGVSIRDNGKLDLPALELGSDQTLTLSFDEMSHTYHRYTYKIVYCNAEWGVSDLFESEYMEGFSNQPLQDYSTSLGTTVHYTHYSLSLPNQDFQFRLSGNYKVEVYDSDVKVLEAKFMLYESLATVTADFRTNTDLDVNSRHQQLDLTLQLRNLTVTNPRDEIKTVVMQNRNIDEMVTNLKPSHLNASQIQYKNNRQLIFPAGNEFRRFEVVDMYDFSQGVSSIELHEPYFHATLLQDKIHRSYTYDRDQNGRYTVRRVACSDSDTEADWMFVHFSVAAPQRGGGKLYLSGDLTQYNLTPEWEMEYNHLTECYELAAFLKQGAYSYRYVWLADGAVKSETAFTEGDFFETENEYLVLVYHHAPSSRYDRLISLYTTSFIPALR